MAGILDSILGYGDGILNQLGLGDDQGPQQPTPVPSSQYQAPPSRADAAPLATIGKTAAPQQPFDRSLPGLLFNPKTPMEKELSNKAWGRFLGGRGFGAGVGDALGGIPDDVANYSLPTKEQDAHQLQQLQVQELQNKIAQGNLVEVGHNTGVFYDRSDPSKLIRPTPEALAAAKASTDALAKPDPLEGLHSSPGYQNGIQLAVNAAIKGDYSLAKTLGRDQYTHALFQKVMGDSGATPEQIARADLNWKYATAAETSSGTRSGNVDIGADEVATSGNNLLDASKNYPRGNFRSWNALSQYVDDNLNSNPDLVTFKTQMGNFQDAAVAMLRRNGAPDDAAKRHVERLASTTLATGGIEAFVNAMNREAAVITNSPAHVRDRIIKDLLDGADATDAASGNTTTPPPAKPKVQKLDHVIKGATFTPTSDPQGGPVFANAAAANATATPDAGDSGDEQAGLAVPGESRDQRLNRFQNVRALDEASRPTQLPGVDNAALSAAIGRVNRRRSLLDMSSADLVAAGRRGANVDPQSAFASLEAQRKAFGSAGKYLDGEFNTDASRFQTAMEHGDLSEADAAIASYQKRLDGLKKSQVAGIPGRLSVRRFRGRGPD